MNYNPNGQGIHSKATEEKVLNAIKEIGYLPNDLTPGLINNKFILFPYFSNHQASSLQRY
ncbi:MAG TPA: hypothetical protein DCR24_01750 [Bacillus bacterium]|nr:hypothetical protein [Bacillus sp. (in: firmicutes)]